MNHAQKILEWRESLATLNDNQFFELMRMYLGEIKTPFNKQNLIEDLSSFLRKMENKRKIASLLSESDILVISAIKYITNSTLKRISDFLKSSFTFSKLYERIMNLEERLILYKHDDCFFINPHLDEVFDKVISKSVLIKEANVEKENNKEYFKLTPEILFAFSCFVNENGDICKADGSFKKRIATDIQNRFQCEDISNILKIKNAFENLSIIVADENGSFKLDKEKLKSFSKLPENLQYAYICVAAGGRYTRNILTQQAKLLLDTAFSIPKNGYTKENLLRSMYLLTERKKRNADETSFGSKGRFAAILQNAKRLEEEKNDKDELKKDENVFSILEQLFENALSLGIFKIKGIDSEKNDVFESNLSENSENDIPKVLSIDAAFNAMIFPGRKLSSLIPMIDVLELRKFDTAISFEITKKSVMRFFNSGMNSENLIKILEESCIHTLPQNLLISIEDWRNAFESVSLFKGYILKVTGDKIPLVQKNPILLPYIEEVLAQGIFLLNVSNDSEAEKLLEESGIDFTGKIKTPKIPQQTIDFPTFYIETEINEDKDEANNILTSETERKEHFDYLRNKLESMNVEKEVRECLLFRINRKIILDESQLKVESVKFAKIETTGIDFSGKVHIIEQAVIDKSYIELSLLTRENPDGILAVGLPISTENLDDDVVVSIKLKDSNEIKSFSISQAYKVRRIYSSSFR